jgi:hypothetical protein
LALPQHLRGLAQGADTSSETVAGRKEFSSLLVPMVPLKPLNINGITLGDLTPEDGFHFLL